MGGGVFFFFLFFFRLMKKKICNFFIIGDFIGTRQKIRCFLYAWFFILSNQIYPKGIHEKQQTLYTNEVWAKKVCKLRQNRFSKKHCKMYLTTSMHLKWSKLDGVCTVDNRPSIDKPHPFARRTKKMWQWVNWHVTRDMWHVTHEMWHVVGVNILSKFQLPSSYYLWFLILWRFGWKEWLTQSVNQYRGCFYNSPGYTGSVKKTGNTNTDIKKSSSVIWV